MTKEEIAKALKSWADDCEDFVLETDFSTPFRADARMIREAVQIIERSAGVDTKAAAIMQHYGAQHQLMKLCEECGELIQQAAKCIDKGIPYSEDFVEELADVSVMIEQFKSIFCKTHYELYQKIIQEKLDRQLRRIDDEKA